jgi:hypothetical protein
MLQQVTWYVSPRVMFGLSKHDTFVAPPLRRLRLSYCSCLVLTWLERFVGFHFEQNGFLELPVTSQVEASRQFLYFTLRYLPYLVCWYILRVETDFRMMCIFRLQCLKQNKSKDDMLLISSFDRIEPLNRVDPLSCNVKMQGDNL